MLYQFGTQQKKKKVWKVGFEFVLGHTLGTEVLNTIYLSK